MIDENVAPTPKPDVDFASLSPSPTPEQYFLLSRLDGRLTVGELCKISGLGRKKTLAALESLARAGAIELPGFVAADAGRSGGGASGNFGAQAAPQHAAPADKASSAAGNAGSKKSSAKKRGSKTVEPNFPVAPANFEFDAELLAVDVPLGEAHRRELICLHAQLDEMTFYDVFGVGEDASKKEIKKAYFRMSKRYHPDKFFRKEMAAFGPMLETVFKRITEAYRTLSNKRKRQAYDQELAALRPDPEPEHDAGAPAADSDPGEQNKRKAAAVLLMRRAEKMQAQNDYAKAAGEYRKALALNRDADLAMRVASMLLDEAQLAEEACSFARAALKLGASETAARLLMARALEAEGAAGAAASEYRKVLAVEPDHVKARARLKQLGEDV